MIILFQNAVSLHLIFQGLLHGSRRLHQRQAQWTRIPAQAVHCPFDRDGVYISKQGMAQRQRFQLQFQALCRVTGKPCGTDIVCLLRRNIGKHTDDALTAQGQDRHNLVIVARINVQFLATQGCNIRNLGDIAAGFLYSVYIGQLGKLRQCGGLQIHTGTEHCK